MVENDLATMVRTKEYGVPSNLPCDESSELWEVFSLEHYKRRGVRPVPHPLWTEAVIVQWLDTE